VRRSGGGVVQWNISESSVADHSHCDHRHLSLGFVFAPVGAWTGTILAAWFIGTQRAWRGFVLLAGISFVLNLISNWRGSPLTGIEPPGWAMLAALIGALPFVLNRLTSERRPGFLATLSLPLWGTAVAGLSHAAKIPGTVAIPFLTYWFAAVIVWMWDREFQVKKIAAGASIFGAAFLLVWGSTLSCLLLRG